MGEVGQVEKGSEHNEIGLRLVVSSETCEKSVSTKVVTVLPRVHLPRDTQGSSKQSCCVRTIKISNVMVFRWVFISIDIMVFRVKTQYDKGSYPKLRPKNPQKTLISPYSCPSVWV